MINTTFVFGLLSIFQAIFLPGYLFLKLLRFKTDKLTQAILSFALSMIVNYFIVFFMVLIGIFTTFNIRILFIVEFIIFFILVYRNKQNKSFHDYKTNLQNWLSNLSNYEIIAFGILIVIFFIALFQICNTFTDPDAIWSWNKWAVNWYSGIIPESTGPYPQLIPTNIAIMYSITGYQLQFFPYFFLSLIPFYCLLIPFSIAKFDKENVHKWHLAVIGVLFFINPLIKEVGQADLPVAFMGFISFYFLYISKFDEHNSRNTLYKSMVLSAILIGGAAVTKQAGIYILAVSPALIWIYFFSYKKKNNIKLSISLILTSLSISLLIVASWYILVLYLNTFFGNTEMLIQLTWKKDFLFLFKDAIINRFKLLNFIILISSIIITWRIKSCRYISILIVIPYFLIWFLCFGYDKRNVSILLPFAGCIFGFALYSLLAYISSFNFKVLKILEFIVNFICKRIALKIIKALINFYTYLTCKKKRLYCTVTCLFLIFLFCPLFSYDNLKAFQDYRIISTLGGKRISKARMVIYQMIKNNKLEGKVYTNYQYDRRLPVSFLKKYYIVGDTWEEVFPKDEFIKENNIKYLFITWPSTANISKINNYITKGILKKIYIYKHFYLLQICK